ncbi:calcium/sodium antiporter [Natronorubrum aibiense]|uniref:Calcium/sodium antiporter n=1 Tax=Natronorubrum aibiense TaxID=348826 RepID=A0A5P9NZ61_9EURY|nr:calcium/sodium antiporter [Natronorubrum aibiense]QFU81174.1 calcium/sodium antiporter [Natronorubrum aibiense]
MVLAENVALLSVGILALWLGARWLVDAASRLAAAAGISPLIIGLTVVAFGTSAPEIAVSATAALEGQGDVSVGNVVGSNVFNIGLILGLVAVLAPFRVTETLLRRDAVAMGGATVIAALTLANRVVSRLEGAVLVSLLVGYIAALGIAARRSPATDSSSDGTIPEPDTVAVDTHVDFRREIGRLLVGLVLVVVGGRVLVDSATAIALSLGVSAWLVGVTVVAAGTSLPELVTSVVATRQGDVTIAAGNVIGSNVFNLLGVLGLAALVRPTAVDPAVFPSLVWLLALTAIATVLIATGRRVTRLEGVVLVVVGAGYWLASAVV